MTNYSKTGERNLTTMDSDGNWTGRRRRRSTSISHSPGFSRMTVVMMITMFLMMMSSSSFSSSVGAAAETTPDGTVSEQENDRATATAKTETSRDRLQVALDPMEIHLVPTPIVIPSDVLQADVDTVLDGLMEEKMRQSMGDAFMYWLTTGATTQWYSGDAAEYSLEESRSQYSSNNNGSITSSSSSSSSPSSSSRSSGASTGAVGVSGRQREDGVPYTSVMYKGAVVLIDTSNQDLSTFSVDKDAMQSMVQTIIEMELVNALKELTSSTATTTANIGAADRQQYYEIETASVYWNTFSRQPPGNNIIIPVGDDENINGNDTGGDDGNVLVEPPSDMGLGGGGLAVEKIQDSDALYNNSSKNWTASKTTGIVIGSFLLVSATLFFLVQRRKRFNRSRRGETGAFPVSHDLEMDRSPDDDDDIDHGGEDEQQPVRTLKSHSSNLADREINNDDETSTQGRGVSDDTGTVQTNDASEMAHYQDDMPYQQGELFESVSVASQWTLGTDAESSVFPSGSTSGGNHVRLQKAAEMLAAKETFDRDRQVTLQKDMLQTAWSTNVASNPPVDVLSALSTNTRSPSPSQKNSLSFEQAQGEEVYLMPGQSSRKDSPSRSRDAEGGGIV